MARHLFGGSLDAWTFDLGDDMTSQSALDGQVAVVIPAVTVTLWTAATGGTQYTDLLDSTATPVTSIDSDATGEIPEFSGPDTTPDTWRMWADANGGAGPRRLMVATDMGDVLTSLAPLVDLAGLVDQIALWWPYDYDTASWPVRPAAAGARMVIWKGPSPPPVGGGYMIDGTDIFVDELP